MLKAVSSTIRICADGLLKAPTYIGIDVLNLESCYNLMLCVLGGKIYPSNKDSFMFTCCLTSSTVSLLIKVEVTLRSNVLDT